MLGDEAEQLRVLCDLLQILGVVKEKMLQCRRTTDFRAFNVLETMPSPVLQRC
jgi:hypothetical protein